MPGLSMNPTIKDKDIADIATYIRHAWSNRSALVEEEFIKAARAKTKGRNGIPYTEKDFK
jgi:mono/diheme cytochrome c family protein